jgi:outer membrane protein OmpA-like peptidoglycan-associated protein
MANQKLGKTIGILILLGGGGYLLWHLLTKKKRECKKAGGTWDAETKTCVLPKKDEEIVKKAYDNLTFASGKDVILESSYASLNDLAEYLNKIPALSISIEGHTDSQGDEDYNQKLSSSRANSVKRYLVSKGVAENRIKTVGYGEIRPIADNKTSQGREKNRRVEFIIA